MSRTRLAALGVVCAVAAALFAAGCTPQAEVVPDDPAAGSQLAQGLHDMGDGSVQAVGILSYRNLEGGFWALTEGPEGSDSGAVIVVVANAAEFEPRVAELAGTQVIVTGRRLEGASIRMAGPEMEAASVEAYGPSADPAK